MNTERIKELLGKLEMYEEHLNMGLDEEREAYCLTECDKLRNELYSLGYDPMDEQFLEDF